MRCGEKWREMERSRNKYEFGKFYTFLFGSLLFSLA
jgi:hypothetical protein